MAVFLSNDVPVPAVEFQKVMSDQPASAKGEKSGSHHG
jgi:hypothetical protein